MIKYDILIFLRFKSSEVYSPISVLSFACNTIRSIQRFEYIREGKDHSFQTMRCNKIRFESFDTPNIWTIPISTLSGLQAAHWTSRGYVAEFYHVFIEYPRSQAPLILKILQIAKPRTSEKTSNRGATSRDALRISSAVVPTPPSSNPLAQNRTFFSIERHPPSVSTCCAATTWQIHNFLNCSQCNYVLALGVIMHYL